MKTAHATMYVYETEGSAALAARPCAIGSSARPQLRVIEGERRARDTEQALGPSRGQTLALIAGIMLSLALALGAWAACSTSGKAYLAEKTADISEQTITVAAGDSLLSLAESHRIDGLDAYETSRWIEQRNGLSSAELLAGQALVVPR